PPAPYIAVPTTSGTGAEVTRNAVLASPENHVKVSMRSPMMLPRLALIDPELTYSLPPDITASTGLDALTQVIEPYVSNKANPMTDAFCREGMRYGSAALMKAYLFGNDPAARTQMSLTSLFGGLALANSGLGAAHGFAGPIGGMFPAPHGAVCARLLPIVMETNISALRARDAGNAALGRYEEAAKLLTRNDSARAEDGVAWIQQLCQELHIPALSSYGVTAKDIPGIVAKSAHASSMKGNPVQLTGAELESIMERAL
ncbi:MAG: iron-containing alcohol dehydrogenase, partial [Omnitrophica WOR_2 bacterium]